MTSSMVTLLSKKKRYVFAVFLRCNNKALSFTEIYSELTKQGIKISKRTVKNTLDEYNQYNTVGNPPLLKKKFDKIGGTCFQIHKDDETFIELARNLLHTKEFGTLFYRSTYTQTLLSTVVMMQHIEKNLHLDFDAYTRRKIHQIIRNSPSALYFGLFAKELKSQKEKGIDVLPEEAEHEIRENFISRLLDDLRDKDFFLSTDIEKLEITIDTLWKYKRKKSATVELQLMYTQ